MDLTQVARFHVAPGYDPADPDSWVWEDRSADVNHVDGGITIRGGRADETSLVGAGSATLQVDNAGGHYCTQNPYGRWYERLAQGCPARWGVVSGSSAFSTPSTNGWGTPDVGGAWVHAGTLSEWSVSGGTGQKIMSSADSAATARPVDADARHGDAVVTIMSPVVATGAPLVFGIQARYSTASNIYFSLDLDLAGALKAQIRRDVGGGLTDLASTTLAWTYSASQRIRMRCQWDGHRLRMRVWPEASAEPTTWDVLAADTEITGSEVRLRCWRVVGNTNSNAVFHFDDFEIEAVEIVGTIEAWPVEWDDTATVSWAGIEIAGISERLGVGQEQLMSPIRRQLAGLTSYVQGYWPLEDAANATRAASAVVGRPAASVTDGTFGATGGPPGGSSALTLNTASVSRVTGSVPSWTIAQDGYACMAYITMPAAVVGGTGIRLMEVTSAGTIRRWTVDINDLSLTVTAYLADGSVSFTGGPTLYGLDVTRPWAIALVAAENGANVDWDLYWHTVGSTGFGSMGSSYAGTADRAITGAVWAPVNGTVASHLWVGSHLLPFVDSTFMLVSNGYASERASDRADRLGRQTGISVGVEPGNSERLGIQKPGTFGAGMRSLEAADMGIQYESGAYLAYRPRGGRENQPTWMTWAIGTTGDIAGRPKPVDDNQRVRNRWTVTREDGGEATAQDDDHIARSGPRPDFTTINIYDPTQLRDHAGWRVHLGTWPEYRWPTIEVDFTDSPSQLALWRGRPFAPRIRLTGIPSQGPIGVDADLIVEGWTQEITSHSWKVTASCSPARPWDIGVWDSTASKWGLKTGTTVGSTAAATTTITVAITSNFEALSSADAYDVVISGERIGVPIGGAGARIGSLGAWQQVLTGVTRAKNGISKTLPAGSAVTVYQTGRWSIL